MTEALRTITGVRQANLTVAGKGTDAGRGGNGVHEGMYPQVVKLIPFLTAVPE